MVIIDTFSKWVEAYPIKAATAKVTASVLWERVYCRWGLPLSMERDRGTTFTGDIVRELQDILGIQHRLLIAHHPQSLGMVKRMKCTLKKRQNWVQYLPSILQAIRATEPKSTGYSPYEVMPGRKMRL